MSSEGWWAMRRWWRRNSFEIQLFGLVGLAIIVLVWTLAYFSRQGCEMVCEGQGAEAFYDWRTSCWCRDARGLYNPKDSREDR